MTKKKLTCVTNTLGGLLCELFESNSELGGILSSEIYKDYLIKYYKNSNEIIIKQHITKSINLIISNFNNFKIGKTGIPFARAKQYLEYNQMFLLCESRYSDLIENLEIYYNKKYLNHPNNDNINKGSACRMSKIDNKYYLYLVVC